MTAELVPVETQSLAPANLFGTDNPKSIIAAATARADALADVVKKKGLASNIQGREYVRVEGWTLLGTLMGVFPVCVWTRQLDNGWEARVEARTLDGLVVGAAEAQCSRDENTWKGRSEFALRSMAQTRATSKAMRLPLGFVMALAGFEATPAEEMDDVGHAPPAPRQAPQRAPQRPQTPRSEAVDRVIEGEVREVPAATDLTQETHDALVQAYQACRTGRGQDAFKAEVYPVLKDRWPRAFKGTSNEPKALTEAEASDAINWLRDQTPFVEEVAQPSLVE